MIYQTVDEKLNGKVNLETRTINRDVVFVATKPKTKLEMENEERKRVETELKDFDEALGFTKVLRAIVNSVRTII